MAAHNTPFQWNTETLIIVAVMAVTAVWTTHLVLTPAEPDAEQGATPAVAAANDVTVANDVTAANTVVPVVVPLATGREPIDKIFVLSGCPVCHRIPGIAAAKGREGPKLELGTNAKKRLADPAYHGAAVTEWEYVQESILTPGAYLVPGYRDHVMPRWYGRKLSAAALDKIIKYLLRIEAVS